MRTFTDPESRWTNRRRAAPPAAALGTSGPGRSSRRRHHTNDTMETQHVNAGLPPGLLERRSTETSGPLRDDARGQEEGRPHAPDPLAAELRPAFTEEDDAARRNDRERYRLCAGRYPKKYQTIEGFGGASRRPRPAPGCGYAVHERKRVIDLYFGENGAGYTVGRVHMNSCDFCVSSYDFAPVDNDYELKHFDSCKT